MPTPYVPRRINMQVPKTVGSDPPPFNPPPLSPQSDWTDTVKSFILRLPVWARLAALGVVGLLILVVVSVANHKSAYDQGMAYDPPETSPR
jgi:hypothetical protein